MFEHGEAEPQSPVSLIALSRAGGRLSELPSQVVEAALFQIVLAREVQIEG
jgi:hypothetical protein